MENSYKNYLQALKSRVRCHPVPSRSGGIFSWTVVIDWGTASRRHEGLSEDMAAELIDRFHDLEGVEITVLRTDRHSGYTEPIRHEIHDGRCFFKEPDYHMENGVEYQVRNSDQEWDKTTSGRSASIRIANGGKYVLTGNVRLTREAAKVINLLNSSIRLLTQDELDDRRKLEEEEEFF